MTKNLGKMLYFSAFLVLAGIYVSGCAPEPVVKRVVIPMEEVRKIEPAKTSKRELFEKFGPPGAIAAKDEVSTFPAERIAGRGRTPPPTLYGGGAPLYERHTLLPYYRIDSDTLFELFSIDRQLTEYHRIYYYSDSITRSGVYEPESRLWILINEKTSIVEDYIFRKHYNIMTGRRGGGYFLRDVKPFSSVSTGNP